MPVFFNYPYAPRKSSGEFGVRKFGILIDIMIYLKYYFYFYEIPNFRTPNKRLLLLTRSRHPAHP